jgi:quercetin dioxygenase-like cupin family protein
MDRATFEAELTRDGYTVVSVTMQPDAVNPEHVHPFDARLLVTEGAMTIVREDAPTRTYQVGETFEMPVGTRHSETAGSAGAVYVAGRRVPEHRRAS